MSAELSGFVGSGATMGMQMVGQSMLQKDAQRYNTESMKMANRMAVANQINSARNVVEGYKRAGLSPALAANGNFSPAQAPSAPSSPMGSVAAPSVAASVMELSQAKLLDAEARKANAEADRMEHEDSGANNVIKSFAERVLNDSAHDMSPDDVAYWESVKRQASEGDYNVGDIDSQHRLENLIQNHTQTFDSVYSHLYQERLMQAYLSHEVPEVMANMREGEFKQLALVMGKLSAETLKINSDVVLNTAKEREIEANIQKLLAEAKSIYHGDISAMWQAGDYSALLSKLTYDTAQSLIGFAGMGKVAKALNAGQRVAGSPTMQRSVLMNVDRQVNLSRKQYSARQWAETMHKRNKQLGESERSRNNAWKRSNALENELLGSRLKRSKSGAFPNTQENLPF